MNDIKCSVCTRSACGRCNWMNWTDEYEQLKAKVREERDLLIKLSQGGNATWK